ncbi:ABC transporter substrate-binding protein [Photobacterium iliopiscarium]|uniref:ABC transporter substrate-binding protein n=1 Tax=Photobacterium iliopiscarium TaxID=56192 RepID=UPI0005D39B45|nr:ABC transporter substrate-binding protein [Photobacterium iliopiscarium]PST98286.1 ABC transporter substrate-binding protein [Photobacterium iliopiscarium]PSV80241.1 ABC transporter substrate-binding protein [Photobacterium iliopiscarium]
MYQRLKNLFFIGCLCTSTACLSAETSYPITVIDASQQSLTLTKTPARVDSKSMFSDQVLMALLPLQNITSLSRLSKDPTYSIIADKIPTTLPLRDLNVEQIIAEHPDLVLVASWSNGPKIAQLRAAGINVFVIKTVYSLKNIEKNILLVGQLVNKNADAIALVNEMNTKLKQQVIIPQKKLTALEYTPWGASSNHNSTINTIINHAQLNNLIANTNGDKFGQVPIAKEQLLALNPDVIIIPGTDKDGFKQQLLHDPALQTLTAIRDRRVISLPHSLRSTDSQYIADAIIYLNHKVYQPHARSSIH